MRMMLNPRVPDHSLSNHNHAAPAVFALAQHSRLIAN
jgi:hypothetical protein